MMYLTTLGSSGGSLTAAVLCLGHNVREIVDFVISKQAECAYNPFKMLPAAEEALNKFRVAGMEKKLNGRLSVLVTRINFKALPFVLGEAVRRRI